jgi:hypothetical protein
MTAGVVLARILNFYQLAAVVTTAWLLFDANVEVTDTMLGVVLIGQAWGYARLYVLSD